MIYRYIASSTIPGINLWHLLINANSKDLLINLANVLRLKYIITKDTRSTLVETLYHFSLCLNRCIEAFLLLIEQYPSILSLKLDLSLSNWYCAIMRLPTILSSSRSLSSLIFGAIP